MLRQGVEARPLPLEGPLCFAAFLLWCQDEYRHHWEVAQRQLRRRETRGYGEQCRVRGERHAGISSTRTYLKMLLSPPNCGVLCSPGKVSLVAGGETALVSASFSGLVCVLVAGL